MDATRAMTSCFSLAYFFGGMFVDGRPKLGEAAKKTGLEPSEVFNDDERLSNSPVP